MALARGSLRRASLGERPMRIWLARMDDTPFRYPAKLEARTGFGTIRGRLLYFRDTVK